MNSAGQPVVVTPATATHFAVAPATAVAGSTATFTVTALDAYGNPATGYIGTARFTSSDGQAALPAPTSFVANDAGVKTVTAVLKSVASGGQKLSAFDTSNATIAGVSAPSR